MVLLIASFADLAKGRSHPGTKQKVPAILQVSVTIIIISLIKNRKFTFFRNGYCLTMHDCCVIGCECVMNAKISVCFKYLQQETVCSPATFLDLNLSHLSLLKTFTRGRKRFAGLKEKKERE